MEILSSKNLVKVYRTKGGPLRAVDNVSFSVNSGEIVGILGPNGAGKSTIIKMITGLATPTEGEITVMGHSVLKNREKAMSFVGGVIEQPDLFLSMSAYDNMKYLASLSPKETMTEDENELSLTKKQLDEKRTQELLKLVNLHERQHDAVRKYSLGMKQRLGIAQALLGNPKFLVLDEPANGLDPLGIKSVRMLLRNLAAERDMGILVSSHQLAEMQLMCDRILIISNGIIRASMTIAEINDQSKTLEDVYVEAIGGGFNV